MDIICQPLVAAMRRSWLQLVFQVTLVLIAMGTLVCLAAQLDFVGAHFSAIGRLLMIKVLPIWNWQPLYYENCMMNNPFYNDYAVTEEDCVVSNWISTYTFRSTDTSIFMILLLFIRGLTFFNNEQ
jgi:hypothetical protein